MEYEEGNNIVTRPARSLTTHISVPLHRPPNNDGTHGGVSGNNYNGTDSKGYYYPLGRQEYQEYQLG